MKYFAILLILVPTISLAQCTDAQLFTELSTDPATLAYATAYGKPITTNSSGNDKALLDTINLIRAGAPYQIQRSLVPAYEVAGVFDPTEFNALTALKLQQITSFFAALQIDFSSQTVRDIWFTGTTPIFGAGNTKNALIALVKRQGSRAEIVCGTNRTLSDISAAIRGTR